MMYDAIFVTVFDTDLRKCCWRHMSRQIPSTDRTMMASTVVLTVREKHHPPKAENLSFLSNADVGH